MKKNSQFVCNFNTYNYNNIIFNKIYPYKEKYFKLNIYNGESDIPFQKFWIKLEKVKVINIYKNELGNNIAMKIALPKTLSDNIIFINTLEKKLLLYLENNNFQHINLKQSISNSTQKKLSSSGVRDPLKIKDQGSMTLSGIPGPLKIKDQGWI